MKLKPILLLAFALALSAPAQAQHGHLNAGALGTNLTDKLYFVNGALFAAESGYVRQMTFMTTGTYSNYYAGNISFTALAATTNNGGPAFHHPALGSFVVAEITSVEGPEGGAFGFWESGARSPSYSIPAGTTNGTSWIELSDIGAGAGLPEADPYGHIHGRQFTLSKPGTYKVGFTLKDIADYYPVHSDSDTFYINFSAGYRLEMPMVTNSMFAFHVNPAGSTNVHVEAAESLSTNTAWLPLAGPLTNSATAVMVIDTNSPPMGSRFYRVVQK
jgi:hypothetical protein